MPLSPREYLYHILRAIAFYQAVGFHQIATYEGWSAFGMNLAIAAEIVTCEKVFTAPV